MRTLWAVFEAGGDRAYQALIPAPFGPPRRPLIQVSVASVDEVSPRPFRSYREATLLVAVRLGLTEGWYPVMMPVTSRVGQWRGRWRGRARGQGWWPSPSTCSTAAQWLANAAPYPCRLTQHCPGRHC